jgi:predicted PurR-regulated permease PerM
MKEEKHYSKLQVGYFATLLIAVLVLAFFIFKPFLMVLVISGTLAVTLNPVYLWILRRVKIPSIASLLTILIGLIVIGTPLFFLGRQVFLEARNAYLLFATGSDVSVFGLDFLEDKIENFIPNFNLDLEQYVAEASRWFLGNLGLVFSGTLDFALKFFLVIVALFYFLKDGPKFKKVYFEISPLPNEYDQKIVRTLHQSMVSIVRGSFLIAILQGTLSGIGFYFFGLPNPALWGLIAAISALIPGVGTSLVVIPAVIFLFLTSSLSSALGLLVWGSILVGLVDNFLSPMLLERGGINIHPLFILFSIIGGLIFFGPAGFIVGPLVLSLLFTLFDIYDLFIHQEKIEKKEQLEKI